MTPETARKKALKFLSLNRSDPRAGWIEASLVAGDYKAAALYAGSMKAWREAKAELEAELDYQARNPHR